MDLREFEAKKAKEREQQLEAQTRMLDNEVRVCTRCGWRQSKQFCLSRGIKACPNCGNTECRAMSMDFDDNMMRRRG